jgi:hypothetical protein
LILLLLILGLSGLLILLLLILGLLILGLLILGLFDDGDEGGDELRGDGTGEAGDGSVHPTGLVFEEGTGGGAGACGDEGLDDGSSGWGDSGVLLAVGIGVGGAGAEAKE